MVADEIDARDARHRAFIDLEDEVDAVLIERYDLGIDAGGKAAATAIEIEQALHIGLHLGPRVDDARAQLELGIQRGLVEFVISLERDPVDDRIFDDPDYQDVAFSAQIHVGEEPRGKQRLQRAIDALIVEGIARLQHEIRAHGFRLDALSSLDAHFAHGSTALDLRQGRPAPRDQEQYHRRRGEATCRTTYRKPQ